MITKFKLYERFYSDEYIDSLIDKIGEGGRESLTPEEMTILKSKSINHKDIDDIINRIKELNIELDKVKHKMNNEENPNEKLRIFREEFGQYSNEMYSLIDELEYTYKLQEIDTLLGFKT
jgi:uncharacterized protein Yka (UPF0111/DUF47 family)